MRARDRLPAHRLEKSMEQKSWWKAINYPSRIDYLASFQNEMVFVLAIEKLLGIEVPARATWVRMALAELNRIHSHLIWLGTVGLELGVQSLYFYCFEQRENVLDLFEMVTGVRGSRPLLPGRRTGRGYSARLRRRGAANFLPRAGQAKSARTSA